MSCVSFTEVMVEEKKRSKDIEQLCCICFLHISRGPFSLNQLNSQWCERRGLVRQPADSTCNGLSNNRASENQQGARRWCFIYRGTVIQIQIQASKLYMGSLWSALSKNNKAAECQREKQKLRQQQGQAHIY